MASLPAWPTSGPPLLLALSLDPTRGGLLARPAPTPPVMAYSGPQGILQSSHTLQAVSNADVCNICKSKPSPNRPLYTFPSTPTNVWTALSRVPNFFSSLYPPHPGVNLEATGAVVRPLFIQRNLPLPCCPQKAKPKYATVQRLQRTAEPDIQANRHS